MEMYLFQGRAVNFRLGDRQQLEYGDSIINHLLRKATLADNVADFLQSAVRLMTVHVAVIMMVMRFMVVAMAM